MISSFFNRSKPINFIAIGVYMTFFFVFAQFSVGYDITPTAILKPLGGLVVYLISMVVLHYLAQRNNLSRKNSHSLLLFAFLTAILPYALQQPHMIAANFFVLLGLRSILSLRNSKYVKNKIFDAATCIGIASLFYFWSILFIGIVFLGVFYFAAENYRHWIIPIVGLAMVYLFANCFTLLQYDAFFLLSEYSTPISFDFSHYRMPDKLFSLGITVICIVFFFLVYSVKSKQKSTKRKPARKLLIIHVCIGIAIAILTPVKDTSTLIFIAAPLAIIGTSYLKLSHRQWVQEVNIWVFLVLPVVTLFL